MVDSSNNPTFSEIMKREQEAEKANEAQRRSQSGGKVAKKEYKPSKTNVEAVYPSSLMSNKFEVKNPMFDNKKKKPQNTTPNSSFVSSDKGKELLSLMKQSSKSKGSWFTKGLE